VREGRTALVLLSVLLAASFLTTVYAQGFAYPPNDWTFPGRTSSTPTPTPTATETPTPTVTATPTDEPTITPTPTTTVNPTATTKPSTQPITSLNPTAKPTPKIPELALITIGLICAGLLVVVLVIKRRAKV